MSIQDKGLISSFIRGGDTWWHRMQMFTANAIRVLYLAVPLFFLVWGSVVWIASPPKTWDVIYYNRIAAVANSIFLGNVVKLNVKIHGDNGEVIAENRMRAKQVLVETNEYYKSHGTVQIWSGFLIGGGLSIALIVLSVYLQIRWGKRVAEDEFLRGAKIAEADAVKKMVKDPSPIFSIGGVPIPREVVARNFLLTGGQGSGKSEANNAILDSLRAHKKKVVVYDKTGELTAKYFRPGVDSILNPLDARTEIWSPFSDMHLQPDFHMLASFFVPEPKASADPHWANSARQLLSDVMEIVFAKHGRSGSLLDIYDLVIKPLPILAEILRAEGKASGAQITGDEKDSEGKSIRSTLVQNIRFFPFMPKAKSEARPFSVREFVTRDDDSWLFLTSRSDQHAILMPFISMWLELALTGAMTREPAEHGEIRLVFDLDELGSLQRNKALEIALTEARKFAIVTIVGLQNVAKMDDLYGHDIAKVILSQLQNKLILRADDDATAKRYSALLGKEEVEEVNEGSSYGIESSRDGSQISSRRTDRDIVVYSDIMNLEDKTGYLKIAGNFPVCKIQFPYIHREKKEPDFVQRDELLIGNGVPQVDKTTGEISSEDLPGGPAENLGETKKEAESKESQSIWE